MDTEVVERRRKLAMLQHERVMEEAAFVAQLAYQARNRANAAPVRPRAIASTEVRQRIDWQLTGQPASNQLVS